MASKEELLDSLSQLVIKKGTPYYYIARLINQGFFDKPKKTDEILVRIKGTTGKRLKSSIIQIYMKKFMGEEIIASFSFKGEKGNYWYLSSIEEAEAKSMVRSSKKEKKLVDRLFSDDLIKKLKPQFEEELKDLHLVFGKSGTCTAFLLRKILEKLIFLVFAKHGLEKNLEKNGELVGLKSMIDLAMSTKNKGKPFIMPRTGKEINGIKFLGDAAAHNPLVNVDMCSLLPQMPFIIIAYQELTQNL